MAWRTLSPACVGTRAEQKAACPVYYKQESQHVEELGGGPLTWAGPAAFTNSLSQSAQHLPLGRGKADLGSGAAKPRPHQALLGSHRHAQEMALLTNTTMKRSTKDKARDPSQPVPVPSCTSAAGLTPKDQQEGEGSGGAGFLQQGGVGKDHKARRNGEMLRVGGSGSGLEHGRPKCCRESQ